MSFAQFRADAKRARSRRRIYARINAMPESTVREELLAIVQRHELSER
jgi:hypothetical protein